MATTGKKKKNTTWKTLNTDAIIDTTRKPITWADEVEELDGIHSHSYEPKLPPKVELPTAPRASRGSAFDESKVPSIGPFQAYLSNIPYDLNEDELAGFFQDLKIKNITLPKEEKTNKARGYGYIEFEDRTGLVTALGLADTMLKGRVIKIDLPNNETGRGRGGRGNRDMGRDQTSSDRTTGNWRSGPRQDDFNDRSYDRDRGYGGGRRDYGAGSGGGGGGSGYSRGGFDREEKGFFRDDRERFDRGGGRDDRGGRDDMRNSGGFRDRYDRDRGFGGRDRDSYSYNDRGFRERGREDDRFNRDDRGGSGGGSSSGHWRDEPRENRGFGGGGGGGSGSGGRGGFDDRRGDRDRDSSKFGPPRRDEPPMERGSSGGGGGEPRNRPKLQLQPRTKPKEAPVDSGSASASIFGGAKPVDTAAREREIEERLMRSEDFSDARSSKSGPGSTGSRGEKQWEPPEKRVEPAPPPKENAWSRKAPQVVNNGRSSPDEEGSRSNIDSDERSQDDSRSRRTGGNERKA